MQPITVAAAERAARVLGLPNVVLIRVNPTSGAVAVATWGETAPDKLAAAHFADMVGEKVCFQPKEVHEDFRLGKLADAKAKLDRAAAALADALGWAAAQHGRVAVPEEIILRMSEALAAAREPVRPPACPAPGGDDVPLG